MGRPRKKIQSPGFQIPSPIFTPREWDAVVKTLHLSPRQARIVELIIQGQKDKQIAATLGCNVWTVRTHLTRMFRRLGLNDRVELVVRVFLCARASLGAEGTSTSRR